MVAATAARQPAACAVSSSASSCEMRLLLLPVGCFFDCKGRKKELHKRTVSLKSLSLYTNMNKYEYVHTLVLSSPSSSLPFSLSL